MFSSGSGLEFKSKRRHSCGWLLTCVDVCCSLCFVSSLPAQTRGMRGIGNNLIGFALKIAEYIVSAVHGAAWQLYGCRQKNSTVYLVRD